MYMVIVQSRSILGSGFRQTELFEKEDLKSFYLNVFQTVLNIRNHLTRIKCLVVGIVARRAMLQGNLFNK